MKIVGLIPAAGRAARLFPLPCSKELIPIGGETTTYEGESQFHPKPVAKYLLERMALANAQQILMIISTEKFDIPKYFRSGQDLGISISYLIQESARGMPDALNKARIWVENSTVLFGMPDTIFFPEDACRQLIDYHQSQNADLTLGLFPTQRPDKFGMVAFDPMNRMVYTIDKPKTSDLKFMWGIACWQPTFTRYMAEYLYKCNDLGEIVLGDIFQSALESGLKTMVLPFTDGDYIDIGTPEDLAQATVRFSQKLI